MNTLFCPNFNTCPFYKNLAEDSELYSDGAKLDVINVSDKGYNCNALDAHTEEHIQKNSELQRELFSEKPRCALIEILNNSKK